MKTEWDYTVLADAYLKRPDYSEAALDAMLAIVAVSPRARFCDVGAGVAHLTLPLAKRGFTVVAVEPNDAMRANGIRRTEGLPNVAWHEGTGEATGQPSGRFNMVTFGSSFNVCNRQEALRETARLLEPRGWFACMWNHRHLDDPIQLRIEEIIKERVPEYGYGIRREDQTSVIDSSGLFGPVVHLDSMIVHRQNVEECVQAWRSHATLQRQSGSKFAEIVVAIEHYLKGLHRAVIDIPYSTNIWVARLQ